MSNTTIKPGPSEDVKMVDATTGRNRSHLSNSTDDIGDLDSAIGSNSRDTDNRGRRNAIFRKAKDDKKKA